MKLNIKFCKLGLSSCFIYVRQMDSVALKGRKLLHVLFDIVGTVYHLVIYMQSNKIHKVF